MSITVVFDVPRPSDSPADFNLKAFDTLGKLDQWSTQANALAAEVSADEVAADASKVAAAGSASAATTKAAEALASKVAAELAETNAEAAQAAAALSQSAAAGSATTANTAKLDAQAARDKAQQWADAPLNAQVEAGQYSAKHWAQQAQATVTGQLVYRGGHDASTGAYPANPFKGDYWKIAIAGTVSGVGLAAGDSIIYNGTAWDKIDSTDQVSSVAGRTGDVVLGKGDVGLGNVDNTPDSSKTVSAAWGVNLEFISNVNVNYPTTRVLRTDTGAGARFLYAPILHIGGSDTMWQMQVNHGTGDGTLSFRQGYSGGWGAWLDVISSGNLTTHTAGRNGSGYLTPDSWIQFNGAYGLFSPTNSAHLYPNSGTYGSWMIQGSRNGWAGLEFSESNSSLMMASNTSGVHRHGYGWQWRWQDGSLYCNKNSYGGGAEATVLDTHNYTTWACSHRPEGSNYIDYSRYTYDNGAYDGAPRWVEPSDLAVRYARYGRLAYNNGAYSGSGWVEPSDLGVRYASRASRSYDNFYIDANYGNTIVGAYASTRYQGVYAMGDSYKLPADGTTTGNLYGLAWAHPNAGGAAGNLDSHGLLVLINGGFASAISYSIVASGNVTAYSDERLKTNWRPMPEDYVGRLAKVKVGIYDRIDAAESNRLAAEAAEAPGDELVTDAEPVVPIPITQVGVGAQSLRELLPEAVNQARDEMGTLSVSYGNAALASCVELAKELVNLRNELNQLKTLLKGA